MRRMLILLLVLMMTASVALASEPANPADPEMVAELIPTADLTFVDGIDDGDVLRLLMRRKDGELIFVGGVKEDSGWIFTYSSPLPEGTILGVENFTHSLGIINGTYYDAVSVSPYADGTWGVSLIYPDADGLFSLKPHVIYDLHAIEGYFGDHPWSDITTIDWTSLPSSYEEAVASLDTTRWAVVNNPDPEDRLHLRVQPDRNADSLGKYYNRTPVRIRQYGDEWCAVKIGRWEGYMMTKYLAFGEDMNAVEYAGPWLTPKEHLEEVRLYMKPRASADYTMNKLSRFYVLGVAGDYYHVWLSDTEEYGYVRMDDLWPGNG